MATKVPKRKIQPWQQAGFKTQAAYRASPGYRAALPAGAQTGAKYTFKPTVVRRGTGSPAGNPSYWNTRQGYRQQSEKFPNAPQMPVEFDPNADTNTVQGAINAGQMPWSPSLGNLGYKPPPRAPGSIPIAGTPGLDLWAGVNSDPELQAYRDAISAADAADEASARENINALAVNWGGDLTDLLSKGLIDQGAYDAAKSNQFSQMANLQRQLDVGRGQLSSQLAARGILSSGALPGGEAEMNRQFQQATQTGLQELMGSIRDIRGRQASARAERQSGIAGVMGNVANRLSQMQQYQPIPDMPAFWDGSVQAYVDDWGRRYDRQGNRLS